MIVETKTGDIVNAIFVYQGLESFEMITSFLQHNYALMTLLFFSIVLGIMKIGYSLMPATFIPLMKKAKWSDELTRSMLAIFLTTLLFVPALDFDVISFEGKSWTTHRNFKKEVGQENKKISILLLPLVIVPMNIINELSMFINDNFSPNDDHLKNSYYSMKAVASAMTTSVNDPQIKEMMNGFIEVCLLPLGSKLLIEDKTQIYHDYFDKFLSTKMTKSFKSERLPKNKYGFNNCYEMRESIYTKWTDYVANDDYRSKLKSKFSHKNIRYPKFLSNFDWFRTNVASNFTRELLDREQGTFGANEMSKSPDWLTNAIQYIRNMNTHDSLITTSDSVMNTLFGVPLEKYRGMKYHLKLQKEFMEESKFSQTIIGFAFIIMLFILVFVIYFSVISRSLSPTTSWLKVFIALLMYNPISIFLYKTINLIYFRNEEMKKFAEITNDLSIFAIQSIQNKMYFCTTTYFMAQKALLSMILLFAGYQFMSFLQQQPTKGDVQNDAIL